jgi:gluconolactonase
MKTHLHFPFALTAMACFCLFTLVAPSSRADEKLPATIGSIERLDPALDALLPKDAKIEVLGGGYEWSEGPAWKAVGDAGIVLFSDIPNNVIMQWEPGKQPKKYLEKVGYSGAKPYAGAEPGTNGLLFDDQGGLWMCCHGDRCIKYMDASGKTKVIVDNYEGKKLNSPNDLALHSNGDLYFTDPPYGLPKRYEDPARELDWCGIYRYSKDGKLTLLTKEMTRPNGIAFSPDEKTLYSAQSDPAAAIINAFPVKEDGTLGEPKTIFDATKWVGQRPGAPDGMAVDSKGNLWATAPGGVYILTPEGKILGRLNTGERTANCTFGGKDGKTLFVTADMWFCKVETSVTGAAFAAVDTPKDLISGTGEGWRALTKDDFTNCNLDEDTFVWDGDLIKCKGSPVGVIRSVKPYTNFEMVAEWKHLKYAGNSGIFVWAPLKVLDSLKRNALPHGIEIQVLDLGYEEQWLKNKGKPSDWFTSHGDVFPVGSSDMKPFPPVAPNGKRSFPSKRVSKGVGEWNHYYIRAVDGEVRLWVNGEEVSGGSDCKPATGYICLESEGAPIEFKNLRIKELP